MGEPPRICCMLVDLRKLFNLWLLNFFMSTGICSLVALLTPNKITSITACTYLINSSVVDSKMVTPP